MSSRNNGSLFFTVFVKFLQDTTKRKPHATKCRRHIRKQWGGKKLGNGVWSLIRVNVSGRNSLQSRSLSGQLRCCTVVLLSSSVCLMHVFFCQMCRSSDQTTFLTFEKCLAIQHCVLANWKASLDWIVHKHHSESMETYRQANYQERRWMKHPGNFPLLCNYKVVDV